MPKADDALIKQLIVSQRTARRELQLKNLEAVVFSLGTINEEDELKMEEESREETKKMQELDEEMEREKQEVQENGNALPKKCVFVKSLFLCRIELATTKEKKTRLDELQCLLQLLHTQKT